MKQNFTCCCMQQRILLRRCLKKCVLLLVLVTGMQAVFAGTQYYVKPDGNDGLDGLTVGTAFLTLNHFAAIAQPGDVCNIKGGIYYNQTCYLSNPGTGLKGSAGNEIVFRAVDGEVPIFDGTGAPDNYLFYGYADNTKSLAYLTFDGIIMRNYNRGGIGLDGNVSVNQADDYGQSNIQITHITVRHCLVDQCGQKGFTFAGCSDVLVEDCMACRNGWDPNWGSWSSNFNMFKVWGDNVLVQRCIAFHGVDVSSYHTDGNGFIVDLSYYHSHVKFWNNVALLNGGAGIIMTNSSGGRLANNSVYQNSQDPDYGTTYGNVRCGIGTYDVAGRNDLVLENNIVVQSTGTAFNTDGNSLTGSTVQNNDIQGMSGYVDPSFVNAGAGDVSLQSGSPVINTGISDANTPADALYYDPAIITSQTSGQKKSWWTLAPDYDYITSKGGLKYCIYSIPHNGTADKGAREYAGSTGGSAGPTVYDDALQNGWTYDGWNAGYNISNANPVEAGTKSIAVQVTGAWGAIRFNNTASQNVSGYSGFTFWAYGGSGGNNIQVVFKNNGTESGRKTVFITGGSWNAYTINLSEVGSPAAVNEIWIQDANGAAQNTFYVDDIRFATNNTDYVLYDDAVQDGWSNDSWSANYNAANTSPVAAGTKSTSIQITAAWGAMRYNRSSPKALNGFSSFVFSAYGASGGNSLQIVFKNNGTETGRKSVNITGGSWNSYTVNLADVGSPSAVNEIWIHDGSGGAQPAFYIDQVRFTTGNSFAAKTAVMAQQNKAAAMQLYPNPVTGNSITVTLPLSTAAKGYFSVVDNGGHLQHMQAALLQKVNRVGLPYLPAGVYMLVAATADGRRFMTRFIKQ
ncbi:T9SS type A sorting domain-containing protein [Deminuibacter soli]|uniref:T9SS C-terminal target domain-containing protein n=1 Tax=Deminuibacter soli TaxID=2291815 RepID=A0A3E1NEX0_9BACT|nr:T9SS type A sorting domain-containing protein [Deminuibacter soli]RFM26412.1 T9SS C-terminal target domain-containing protein [Deminuibacter soli]